MNKAITGTPFNINLETVSINKATNVPQDEQDQISPYTKDPVGNSSFT
jgi:hypothetical protein